MGAGSWAAGAYAAGAGATPPIAGARNRAPAAILFDAQTRAHPRDEDGRYIEIHPVDAAVIYALHFEKGRVLAALNQGRKFADIRNPTDNRVRRLVEDRVKHALARLTAAGDVTIQNIRHEAPNQYALFVEVSYYNERIAPRALRSAVRVSL